jgi:hypothetical protein
MKTPPKQHRSTANRSPIPESVWEQIKSGSKEPWRDAKKVVLSGHSKKQSMKHKRVVPA